MESGNEKKLKGASCEAVVLENPFKKRINKRKKRRVRRGGGGGHNISSK